MAFRRRAKRSFKRKYRRGKSGGRRNFRRAVRNVVRSTAETKFYTQTVGNLDIDTSASIEHNWANGLTTGTSTSTRVGNKISVRRLTMRLMIRLFQGNLAAGFNSTYCTVRVMVLYPRKSVDSSTMGTYLNASTPGLYGRPDPSMYMVLYDKLRTLYTANPTAQVPYLPGNGPSSWLIRKSWRCKYEFLYNASNLVDRQPILYIVSDMPPRALDGSFVTVRGYESMSYKDI